MASRIISWISGANIRLDALLQRGLSDGAPLTSVLAHSVTDTLLGQRQAEVTVLSSQLTQGLSIVQGVALTHHSTKAFLGRKYPLDVRNIPSGLHTLDAHPRHAGVVGLTHNFT